MHFIVYNAIHIYVLCYHLIYKGNWKALYLLIWEALNFYNSYPSFPLKFLSPTRLQLSLSEQQHPHHSRHAEAGTETLHPLCCASRPDCWHAL